MEVAHVVLVGSGIAAGCCIGANAIEETFRTRSVAVPIIMLAPLWLLGAGLIIMRWLRLRSTASATDKSLQHWAEQPADKNTKKGEDQVLDFRQFVWIAYVCFVSG